MTFSEIKSSRMEFWQTLKVNQFAKIMNLVALSTFFCFLPAAAMAGLAPSDVVVVVNGGSQNSRTLANHYVFLRGIPASNVIVLNDIPNSERISIDEFRRLILSPLLTEIDRRRLSTHVQCISYSADFPTAIDITADVKPLGKLPIFYTNQASINALTFLYSQVQASAPAGYINLEANFYARRPLEHYFTSPGGDATREQWLAVQQLIAEEKHAEAAQSLAAMFEALPHQFPIAYLGAAEAAQASDKPLALKLLEAAIAKGWTAGGYLANDHRFDTLRNDDDFQVLEFMLDSGIDEMQPTIPFNARLAWTPNGIPIADQKLGLRYMLSTVLGVTRGGGTTLNEAIENLKKTTTVDGTHPDGGFYFCVTKDVRTTTRQPSFERAVADLRSMGFEAEIVTTMLPEDKPAVLGAQIGTPSFTWASCGSTLVPGSIAENLTSLGGVMATSSGQTKLSELIRAGAAASSGTVTEPYALQAKFPHPQLYVHYARGASLAEAYYLSVTGPYQLLIVGDPLCQPFSNAPDAKVPNDLRYLNVDQPLRISPDVSGSRYLDWIESDEPRARRTERLAPTVIGILFDGKAPQAAKIQAKINIQLADLPPGYHEIRLRFLADDPHAQCSETTVPVWIGEKGMVRMSFPKLVGSTDLQAEVAMSTEKVDVLLEALSTLDKKVSQLTLWHDAEQIAVASSSEAEFSISLDSLGAGPVRLQPKAELEDGTIVAGMPVVLNVLP
jgi:uncharacterized protein (TIGR03790 family)